MTLTDTLRLFNGILGLAAFVLFLARLLGAWPHFSVGQKLIFASLMCYITSTVYGSFEIVFFTLGHTPFSIRILISVAANVLILCYLAEPSRLFKQRFGRDPLAPDPGTPES